MLEFFEALGCDLQDLGVDKREVNVTATDGTHFGL